MDLTKQEINSLIIFATFLAFWSFILVPQFQIWIQELPEPDPLMFYPLFNIVYILLFSFLTYVLLRTLGKKKQDFSELATSAFRYGLAGFILLWMIPDLIAPPYLITMQGELLKTHPLWPAVADSFWYSLLSPLVPISMMYFSIYFCVPTALFFLVLLIISPHKLAKIIREL